MSRQAWEFTELLATPPPEPILAPRFRKARDRVVYGGAVPMFVSSPLPPDTTILPPCPGLPPHTTNYS